MSRRCSRCLIAGCGYLAALVAVASATVPAAHAQPGKAPAAAPSPQAPTLTTPINLGAKTGETVELTLTGTNLNDPVGVMLGCPGKVTIPTDNKNGSDAANLRVKVELPGDCPIGMHTIRVVTKQGVSNWRPFVVDELPLVAETETNRTKDTPQAVPVPAVITGRTDTEASDFFKIKVSAGQTVTFEVLARRIGSPLDPIVVLHDAKTKRELIDLYADDTPGLQSDCRLTHTFKESGEYLVEVRDTTYRGGPAFFYRLRIGDFPGATTAFPLAIESGKRASVGFAGPGAADLPAVRVKASTTPGRAAAYAAPKRANGLSGWPVPVLISDMPETIEQEPNNEPAKANKLPVPGGVSARFEKPGDLDHFAVTCKKGVKYAAVAMTYELNSPTEVLIRVLDAKGAEIARSNPGQPVARAEFTPAADGDYVIACEHLNYLSGPNEIYHLAFEPVAPDFTITLALDRCEAPPDGGTTVMATVNRLGGFAGPVELSVVGPGLRGTTTLPAGQAIAFVPLLTDDDAKPGGYRFRVQGRATVDGKEIERHGTLTDSVRAALSGLPNPPPELLGNCAVAVIEKPAFELSLTAEPRTVEKGKSGKVLLEVERSKTADADIAIAPYYTPPNITVTAKPIAKGKSEGEAGVAIAPAAATGSAPIVLRATTKIGGKDYAVIPPPLVIEIAAPQIKTEPKKSDPKKEAKKGGE